ncbi:hypothetical protein, partial [Noviherbaspirillum denitrificans]|uniref:hypothetical protein n=1 Tax=Noviherbaspirillum denitrificans TaxID=1968433 RepID=UPI001981FCAB
MALQESATVARSSLIAERREDGVCEMTGLMFIEMKSGNRLFKLVCLSSGIFYCSFNSHVLLALQHDPLYTSVPQTRGGAVWQLVGLITRRS